MSQLHLTPEMVKVAHGLIADKVTRTPLLTNLRLSKLASALRFTSADGVYNKAPPLSLYFKCENQQKTGSFKYRGVWNRLARLSREDLKRGLVTTSSGNHATALASAVGGLSKLLGHDIPVYVVMPLNASSLKVHNAACHGARVVRSGNSWAEREAAVESLRKANGLTLISSANDPDIILGQGTVGLEMVQQVKDQYRTNLDGGLLSGVGIALLNENIRVFGAEPQDGADDGLRGLLAGERIERVTTGTIADGLRCPIGKSAWKIIQDSSYVKGIFTVSDTDICSTMHLVEENMDMVIEPSAAVPLAVALFNRSFRKYASELGRRVHVGIVFSGGNFRGAGSTADP